MSKIDERGLFRRNTKNMRNEPHLSAAQGLIIILLNCFSRRRHQTGRRTFSVRNEPQVIVRQCIKRGNGRCPRTPTEFAGLLRDAGYPNPSRVGDIPSLKGWGTKCILRSYSHLVMEYFTSVRRRRLLCPANLAQPWPRWLLCDPDCMAPAHRAGPCR